MNGPGLVWGGLFLMATPYLVLAIVGGGLWLAYRREVRAEVDRLIRSVEEERTVDPVPGRPR